MKRLMLLALCLGGGFLRAQEAATPEAAETSVEPVRAVFPLERYQPLWQRSPFQLESIAPAAESAGIAQRFALTGIAEINGEPIAYVMERATQERAAVKKDGSKFGLALVKVDVQKKYADSSVLVRLDGEVGTLKFETAPEMPVAAPPVAMVPPGRPGRIGQPGAPQPVPGAPMVLPGQVQNAAPMPVPPNQVPPQGVTNNGQPQINPATGQPVESPPPRVIRRRALIPSAP